MGYETKIIHPAVEIGLKANGWDYEHEAWLPLQGRADFIATDVETGEVSLLECKKNCWYIKKTLTQILFYRSQMERCDAAVIIVPEGTRTDKAKRMCEEYDVLLLTVKVVPVRTYNVRRKLKRYFGSA